MYTLEHNCKVYSFGRVHEDFIPLLVDNWKYVLMNTLDSRQRSTEDLEKFYEEERKDDDDRDEEDEEDDDNYDNCDE